MNRMKRTLPVLTAMALLVVALPVLAGDGHDHPHAQGKKAMTKSAAAVGHPAPDFTLTDHAGNTHTLSELRGKTVVLEWTNPQCPFVQRHYEEDTMTGLSEKFGEDVVWMAVDSSNQVTAKSASSWAEKESIPYPILLDASGEVGMMYGAKTTPHMYVIDPEGTLVYAGAIDDDPSGKKDDSTNYVAAALEAVMKGEAVTQASTKPYGCSVKYGKPEHAEAKASR